MASRRYWALEGDGKCGSESGYTQPIIIIIDTYLLITASTFFFSIILFDFLILVTIRFTYKPTNPFSRHEQDGIGYWASKEVD